MDIKRLLFLFEVAKHVMIVLQWIWFRVVYSGPRIAKLHGSEVPECFQVPLGEVGEIKAFEIVLKILSTRNV